MLDEKFLQGLETMHKLAPNLLWEFANRPESLKHVTQVVKKFPNMTFILDHLGHLVFGVPGIKNYPIDTWKQDIVELAAQPNVVAKLGDIEEWEVSDPQPYIQHALKTFGYNRCLYESNWFVNKAMGDMYDKTFLAAQKAC